MNSISRIAKRKQELRTFMLGHRKSFAPEALAALSILAQRQLLSQEAWKKAKSVALYKPTQNEVDTELLLDTAGIECKKVFLPRVRKGEKGLMDFAVCRGPQELVRGAYNILEPDPALCPACTFAPEAECPQGSDTVLPPPDIFIIPGLAFDKSGRRLGFGGGYYDRFLVNPLLRERSFFIGFAYSFQVLESLDRAVEEWDQPVHALCTDSGYMEFTT